MKVTLKYDPGTNPRGNQFKNVSICFSLPKQIIIDKPSFRIENLDLSGRSTPPVFEAYLYPTTEGAPD